MLTGQPVQAEQPRPGVGKQHYCLLLVYRFFAPPGEKPIDNLQSAIYNLQLAIGYRLSAIGYFRFSRMEQIDL